MTSFTRKRKRTKRRSFSLTLLCSTMALLLFSGCATEKRISRALKKQFTNSPVLKQYPAGFALYDMAAGHMLFQKNADQYFSPASNTKLFTFYAGLKMLPDSVPSLRYTEQGDSLIFWGTGDPSMLQSKLKGCEAIEFLKGSPKKLYYAPGRYTGDFYGQGWAWDDYNDYYQAEITELPLMDNLLRLKAEKGRLVMVPALFKDSIFADSAAQQQTFRVSRDFNSNHFKHPLTAVPAGYSQEVPYKTSLPLTLSLLSDTLKKPVMVISRKMPVNAKTIYNLKRDTVLKAMMLPSDNFIAEQLLLVYANQLGETLSSQKAIFHIQKTYLNELPDQPRWVDGSGLSRYNLVTPRDLVKLLELIYKQVNDPQRLFDMMPAGGQSGTLKSAYPKTAQPFVFGKTGTLSGVHNQSGYVLTKKGRTYIFSFMNNNYVLPTADVRNEMVRIITYIHEKF